MVVVGVVVGVVVEVGVVVGIGVVVVVGVEVAVTAPEGAAGSRLHAIKSTAKNSERMRPSVPDTRASACANRCECAEG